MSVGTALLVIATSMVPAPAAAAQNLPGAPGKAAAGDAKNGQKLYLTHGCSPCHGLAGQGSSAGARLAPRPAPLARFLQYPRQPTGVMPPYTAKVISDAELADIY